MTNPIQVQRDDPETGERETIGWFDGEEAAKKAIDEIVEEEWGCDDMGLQYKTEGNFWVDGAGNMWWIGDSPEDNGA